MSCRPQGLKPSVSWGFDVAAEAATHKTPLLRWVLVAGEIAIKKLEEHLHADKPRGTQQSEQNGGKQSKTDGQTPEQKPHLRDAQDRQDDQNQAESSADP